MEGREPTRITVPNTDYLLIGSFLLQYEEKYWRHKCVVEGCDHRMGPDTTQKGWTDWVPCAERALPAFVVSNTAIMRPLGMTCHCHTEEILNVEWVGEKDAQEDWTGES